MICREYRDSHGIWHNIEADDYEDMQEQMIEKGYKQEYKIMNPLDIAKECLATAEDIHTKTEEPENVFRNIFNFISVDIDVAVSYHKFETTIVFNWDTKYVNDVIDALKALGYHAELKRNPEYDRLYIKW